MAAFEKLNTAERYLLKSRKAAQGQERMKKAQQDETRTIDENTARLRALRLARDAAGKELGHGKGKNASKAKPVSLGRKRKQREGDR